ncbi:hypothetical protein, partial [Streptomyces xiaopingdaonensis]|uniref:hypothetical protein n=1 Tax=Streptomyces xiaopingdaonensis TaxID=1565415 RepID=UPI00036958B3
LAQDEPREVLRRSGFDDAAPAFRRALGEARSAGEAERVVVRHGKRLWQRAVDRVQGRGSAGGELSRGDDRPLYWARLGMTKALRGWSPSFALTEERRTRLLERLEVASRGHDSARLPAESDGLRRVVVTGFDPFQLDEDIRRSNPSGAAALALDGKVVRTASGERARVETMLFPVRWDDFADGMVEKALLPALRQGARQTDALITVSQGSPGRFDVERYNGAWRGGSPDNVRVSRAETVPVPPGVPTPVPQPQWTVTSLPYRAIVDADTGRFPVRDNTAVTEIPSGSGEPVERPEGPTPGSTARAGGGGNYLSNEIAYRATLLRDAVGARIAGGHLHTPVLEFGEDNSVPDGGRVSDPVFERNREAISAQVREVVEVVAEHAGR